MKSLYGQYISEREGFEIIENEHGFATYQVDKTRCYIRDIYVSRETRQMNLASQMADEVAIKAKSLGCTHLVGSVCPQAKCSTASLKVLLAYGFKLESARDNLIIFTKEL